MKKNDIKVGHDSEAFAYRKGVGYYPMINNVGGTKEHPLVVPGGNLQEDGLSIEMAVDATSSLEQFLERTKAVKEQMNSKVRAAGASLRIIPSVAFSEGIIGSFMPKSIEQGCDPDYNIYTGEENEYPDLQETLFRHGSGHIHVDCLAAVESPTVMKNLVRLMDIRIKAPQWLIEGDVERNKAQGALGNYRPKKYGVEYRSSSNIILTDDKILTHAFEAAQRSSMDVVRGASVRDSHARELRIGMESGNRDTVLSYINHYGGVPI